MFKAPPSVTSLPLVFENAVSDAVAFQQNALASTTSTGWLPAGSPFQAHSIALAVNPRQGAPAPATAVAPAGTKTATPPGDSGSSKKADKSPHVDVSEIVDWAAKQLGAESPKFPGLDGSYEDYKKYAEDALVAYGIKQMKGALNDLVEEGLLGLLSVPVPVAEAASVLGSGGAGLLGQIGQAGGTIGDYLSNPGRLIDVAMEKAGELVGKLPSMAYDKLLDLGLSKLDDFWAVDDKSPLLAQLSKQFVAPFIKSTVKDLLSGVTSLDDLTSNFSDIVDKLDARINQLLHGADPGTGQPAARIGDKDDKTDAIVSGLPTVIVQGQAVSRVLDTLAPSGKAIIEGAATVFTGGKFTARLTSSTCIPSKIATGAAMVLVGGVSASVPPPPEPPTQVLGNTATSPPKSPQKHPQATQEAGEATKEQGGQPADQGATASAGGQESDGGPERVEELAQRNQDLHAEAAKLEKEYMEGKLSQDEYHRQLDALGREQESVALDYLELSKRYPDALGEDSPSARPENVDVPLSEEEIKREVQRLRQRAKRLSGEADLASLAPGGDAASDALGAMADANDLAAAKLESKLPGREKAFRNEVSKMATVQGVENSLERFFDGMKAAVPGPLKLWVHYGGIAITAGIRDLTEDGIEILQDWEAKSDGPQPAATPTYVVTPVPQPTNQAPSAKPTSSKTPTAVPTVPAVPKPIPQ